MTTLDLIDAYDAMLAELYAEGANTDAVFARLELWLADAEDELAVIRLVLARNDANIEFLHDEEKRLANRRKSIMNADSRLRDLAVRLLEKTGGKAKCAQYTAWVQESERVVGPENPLDWPEDLRFTEWKVDSFTARQRLKNGELLPGICLETKKTVRFR